jgi:hypothetical protein
MPYLIGTDEAGYGPNLGPLLITATVWHVEDRGDGTPLDGDLYRRLKRVICRNPSRTDPRRRLAIADSKLLYNPAAGLELLERGVLAILSLLDCCPGDWREIWQALDGDADSYLHQLPWHVGYESPLPCAADGDDLVQIGRKLRRGLADAGVRLVAVRSTAVFPERFNAYTASCGNKAEALSQLTLGLVAEGLRHCAGEPVLIICDKHGGRNHYGRLLQLQFPDPLVEVRLESPAESIYRWGIEPERVEIQFRAGGEAFLPAALASMVSKYLRELAMRPFNDFWCGRVPELKPTAGYPMDARRFKLAIAAAQSELGIGDDILWRSR